MPTPTHADIAEFVSRKAQAGNNFYVSMQDAIERWGDLTERQLACVLRDMTAPIAEPRRAQQFELGGLFTMFDTAKASGKKSPRYTAAGLAISLASDTSPNAGQLYVKRYESGEYLGKVDRSGTFRSVRACTQEDRDALKDIEAAPLDEAVKWGKFTLRCSLCGLTLSDPKSKALGYGPVCAKKWGLGAKAPNSPNPTQLGARTMNAATLADICLCLLALGSLTLVCAELQGIFSRVRIDR